MDPYRGKFKAIIQPIGMITIFIIELKIYEFHLHMMNRSILQVF
jgi:hypothetical protein